MSVPGVYSVVVLHLWLPFSSVWFPCVPSVAGVNTRRVNDVDGIGVSCLVFVSVPGVLSFVVLHSWRYCLYVGSPCVASVVCVNKRRVDVVDGNGLGVMYS